jgi:hypothetical protein
MNCLHCGECCLHYSPFDAPNPCRHLIIDGDFYFCGIYENRPKECANHTYPFRHCPIGIEKLGLDDPIKVSIRIDQGYEKTKSLNKFITLKFEDKND